MAKENNIKKTQNEVSFNNIMQKLVNLTEATEVIKLLPKALLPIALNSKKLFPPYDEVDRETHIKNIKSGTTTLAQEKDTLDEFLESVNKRSFLASDQKNTLKSFLGNIKKCYNLIHDHASINEEKEFVKLMENELKKYRNSNKNDELRNIIFNEIEILHNNFVQQIKERVPAQEATKDIPHAQQNSKNKSSVLLAADKSSPSNMPFAQLSSQHHSTQSLAPFSRAPLVNKDAPQQLHNSKTKSQPLPPHLTQATRALNDEPLGHIDNKSSTPKLQPELPKAKLTELLLEATNEQQVKELVQKGAEINGTGDTSSPLEKVHDPKLAELLLPLAIESTKSDHRNNDVRYLSSALKGLTKAFKLAEKTATIEKLINYAKDILNIANKGKEIANKENKSVFKQIFDKETQTIQDTLKQLNIKSSHKKTQHSKNATHERKTDAADKMIRTSAPTRISSNHSWLGLTSKNSKQLLNIRGK